VTFAPLFWLPDLMSDILTLARAHARSGKAAEAEAMLEEASDAGNGDASAELGLWLLRGDQISRDVSRARRFLGRAARSGNEEAILLEIALSANGSGGKVDWPTALGLLRKGARHHDYLRRELEIVENLDLDDDGYPKRPPRGTLIDERVRMIRYPSFLSAAECQHLANIALNTLRPSTVFDPNTGHQIANPIRSSDGTIIGPAQEDLVVQAICRRIAVTSGTSLQHGEPISILRYSPGHEYKPHFDAIGSARNNRAKTMLMYLNDAYAGGQTAFPAMGLSIEPTAGDAVIFDGLDADGSVQSLSLHAGLPVLRGQKWVATRWIRQQPFDPWTVAQDK